MHQRFGRIERIFVVIALIASVWINWRLGSVLYARSAPSHLTLGTVAPRLELLTLDGKPVTMEFAATGSGTVLYFMSPTCPWCARNEPSIGALARGVGGRFRIVAVAPESEAEVVRRQVEARKPPYDVYLLPKSTQTSYLLRSLPTTLVMDSSGIVLRAWPGAYAGSRRAELEEYFEVPLPEIIARPQMPAGP